MFSKLITRTLCSLIIGAIVTAYGSSLATLASLTV